MGESGYLLEEQKGGEIITMFIRPAIPQSASKQLDAPGAIVGLFMEKSGDLLTFSFIIEICIGGTAGEAISLFFYKQYYPWVIVLASIAVIIIGLIGLYVGKIEALSSKSFIKKKDKL